MDELMRKTSKELVSLIQKSSTREDDISQLLDSPQDSYPSNRIPTGISYTWKALTVLGEASYTGEWLDDKMEGFGIYTYKDGTKYEGYL